VIIGVLSETKRREMIKEGDLILLYKDPKRKYLIRAKKGTFHTDKGFIQLNDIIGRKLGECITTNLGEGFYILKPCLWETIMKIHRQTQIIYPKDTGIILLKSGIYPGAKAIECGCGSGALTVALANFLRPDGKIFSYERRGEFLEIARKNVEKSGLSSWVEFKLREITDAFEEENVDFVMIDIGSPWDLIDAAYKALKPGCRIAAICPSFEQLTHTVFGLQEKGFVNIETLEVLVRNILVRRDRTRPEQRMPSHTGFLILASKTI